MAALVKSCALEQLRPLHSAYMLITLCAYAQQGYAFSRVRLYIYVFQQKKQAA